MVFLMIHVFQYCEVPSESVWWRKLKFFSSLDPWWCILYYSGTVSVMAVCWERPLVTSCTCYDSVLTFELLSKYWIRVAFIGAWLERPTRPLVSLTHSSGEEAVFPLCVWLHASVSVCSGVDALLDECLLCCPVMSLYKLSTTCMCICRIFVGMCVVFVSYTCPVHCDSCTPQQGRTYIQCHQQTWGQQGAPGPLQRLLSFPCSLVPRSTPLLWQVLT